MNLTIINPPMLEDNPSIIVRTSKPSDVKYESENRRYEGKLARINVSNGYDLALIKMLRHGIDYFAPSSGNGILVKPELLIR